MDEEKSSVAMDPLRAEFDGQQIELEATLKSAADARLQNTKIWRFSSVPSLKRRSVCRRVVKNSKLK